MKFKCLVVFFVSIFFSVVSSAENDQEWRFEKEADGVRVYTQAVSGHQIRQYKALTTLNMSADNFIKFYFNFNNWCQWVPDCKLVKTLEGTEGKTSRVYVQINNPWPFKDMDYVLDINQEKDPSTGEIIISFQENPSVMSIEKCCNRMELLRGFWKLLPLDSGDVQVTYQGRFIPSGYAPASMINSMLPGFPVKVINNIKKVSHLDGK